MDRMKPSHPAAVGDGADAQSQCHKLPPAHDAAVALWHIDDLAVNRKTWRESMLHINPDSLHVGHSARMAAESARMAPPTCRCCNAGVTERSSAGIPRTASPRPTPTGPGRMGARP